MAKTIYLASYPRSGNTMLRTLLHHCFGQTSVSIYSNDLGGNKALEKYVGHIEKDNAGRIKIPGDKMTLIKTHELPSDNIPAIYVYRDGRAACASLCKFLGGKVSLEQIVTGDSRFGTWSNHLELWDPLVRADTIAISYEDMTSDLPAVISRLSEFLNCDPIAASIPSRKKISKIDGRWVTKKSDWEKVFTDDSLELFDKYNGSMMVRMGYYDSSSD